MQGHMCLQDQITQESANMDTIGWVTTIQMKNIWLFQLMEYIPISYLDFLLWVPTFVDSMKMQGQSYVLSGTNLAVSTLSQEITIKMEIRIKSLLDSTLQLIAQQI